MMLLLVVLPSDVEEVDNFGRKEVEVLLVDDLLLGDEETEVEAADAAVTAEAAADVVAADVVAVELDDDNIGVLMDDLILLIALESLLVEDVPLFGGDIERDACNKEVLEEVSLVFTCKDDCTGLE